MKDRGILEVVAKVEKQGFRVKHTRKGIQIFERNGPGIMTVHLTCSDHRSLKNTIAILRRMGAEL